MSQGRSRSVNALLVFDDGAQEAPAVGEAHADGHCKEAGDGGQGDAWSTQ